MTVVAAGLAIVVAAEVVENGDLVTVDGEIGLLVARISDRTIDTLAAFGAEGEDVENDLEDEIEEDDDRNSDYALDWTSNRWGRVIIHDGDAELEEGAI